MASRSSRGLGLVEMIVAFAISSLVIGVAFAVFRFGLVATEKTIAPQVQLQAASRIAFLRMIEELQQSIEIVRPVEGSSSSWFVVRDQVNRLRVGYQVVNEAESRASGKPVYDLVLTTGEDKAEPSPLIIPGLGRMTFTALSSGLLQLRADIREEGRTYTILSTVRCRNLYAEGAL